MTDTHETPASGEGVSGGIRPVREMRGSVPISAELFTSTSDPVVIAFQTSAMFAGVNDPDLTLTVLQARWSTSRRGAAGARRTLIDLGYWVEVLSRQGDGRFRVETRTWEARLTETDLADLSAQYAQGSVLECGGRAYVVGADGLHPRVEGLPRKGTPRRRPTTSGHPVRPGETPVTTVTDIPAVVTRPDQAIVDNPVAVLPPVVTRSDLGKQEGSAGRTVLPSAVGQHACLSFGETYACMHDEFWTMIERSAKTPIDRGGRKSVHDQLGVAFQAGWSHERLARWLGEQVTAAKRLSNPAGFVIARLREIPPPADVPPSAEELESRAIDACTFCDGGGFIGRQRCDHDPNGAARIFAERSARRAQSTPGGRLGAPPEPRHRSGGVG